MALISFKWLDLLAFVLCSPPGSEGLWSVAEENAASTVIVWGVGLGVRLRLPCLRRKLSSIIPNMWTWWHQV